MVSGTESKTNQDQSCRQAAKAASRRAATAELDATHPPDLCKVTAADPSPLALGGH